MFSSSKSVLFAVGLCVIISLLLTTASTGLQSYQRKNAEIDRQKNILKAVGLVDAQKSYSTEAVTQLYSDNIKSVFVDSDGALISEPREGQSDLQLYLYLQNEEIKTYIIPINTRGLWGKIYGYLALDQDGQTVSGFTVYKHSETPGLGGEIEKSWFQKNFVGKKIVDRQGDFASIGILKGRVETQVPPEAQANYVDGISGATLTGQFLTAGLKTILQDYEPVSLQFRNNKVNLNPAG